MIDEMHAEPETYYLIDGYAEIFRAYYAIRRPLYSPTTGEPTNAVLVFSQMLLKLLTELRPDHIVFALDAPGETFRDELHRQYTATVESVPASLETQITPALVEPSPEPPGYKGTRIATPDLLMQQVPRILELVRLCGIPVIACGGMEADDVIATLTTRIAKDVTESEQRPRHIRIVSPDKDLEQLITDGDRCRVTLYDVRTGAETDVEAVRQKRGVGPERIVDYLALTGDAVDNIPGVPGIGPRTAAKLLTRYGTLDGIRDNLTEIEPRWREVLAQAMPLQLPLSRRLIELERNAGITFDPEQARVLKNMPTTELETFFEALGLMRLKQSFSSLP